MPWLAEEVYQAAQQAGAKLKTPAWKEWVDDLRFGRLKQTTSRLRDPATEGLCCLGVCSLRMGAKAPRETSKRPYSTGLLFSGRMVYGNPGARRFSSHFGTSVDGSVRVIRAAVDANDGRGLKFTQIADEIVDGLSRAGAEL